MKKYNSDHLKNASEKTMDYESIIKPNLLPLLGDLKDKRVLDVGCGTGKFSRLAASLDAYVMAVDKGQAQIDAAKRASKIYASNIDFIVGNIENLRGLRNNFDLVLLMFVVLDTSNIDDLKVLIRASVEAMKPGASLIIGDVHPHNFNRENAVEWVSAISDGNYFTIGCPVSSRVLMTNEETREFRPSYHYPLGVMIDCLCDCGLYLKRLVEPMFRVSFPTHIILEFRRLP